MILKKPYLTLNGLIVNKLLVITGLLFILFSCEIDNNGRPVTNSALPPPKEMVQEEPRINTTQRTDNFRAGKYPEFVGAIIQELEFNLKEDLRGKIPQENIDDIIIDDPRLIELLEQHAEYLVKRIGSQRIDFDSLQTLSDSSLNYRTVFKPE